MVAKALREDDAKKNTQARVAALLGVSQPTVAAWLDINNISADKAYTRPDARGGAAGGESVMRRNVVYPERCK